MPATALPPADPIITEEQLRGAAAEVPVAKIEFVVPRGEVAIEASLARRFFNRLEEHRYSGVTTADWSTTWQLFHTALVAKADKEGFDAESLEHCLRGLNRGRNRQTLLWPAREQAYFPAGSSRESRAAFERKAEEKYQQALKDRERNPERWYDENLAIIPVGAYLARYDAGECWIVVCKWELISNEATGLGHIMIWAMDTKSAEVVGYVTCD